MPDTRTSIAPFLAILRDAVSRLPNSVPYASISDPIYQHFRTETVADERAFQTFERAFLQCFQPDPNGPLRTEAVMRGEYGVDLVVSYLEDYAKHPTMSSEELKLTALKLQQLVNLVHERIKDAPKPIWSTSGGRRARGGKRNMGGRTKHVTKRPVSENRHSDPYDADYTPGIGFESSGEELDLETEKTLGILGFGKTASSIYSFNSYFQANTCIQGQPAQQIEPQRQDSRLENDESVDSTDIEDTSTNHPGPKPGRSPDKGNWAMTHYEKTPTAEVHPNGMPIWSFKCIWCRASRNIARTPGCTNWGKELPEMRIFSRSNFISHIEQHCDKVPGDQKFFNTLHSKAIDYPRTAGVASTPVLNQREFNSALAKAVVHDNHSMTFGEGDGMIQFFQLILPNIRLPSHQTLQRHLYRLFEVLGNKVKDNLKTIKRHAIATDGWTSKNSVYSLAGVILFFIDGNWCLRELVLDIINLDAEHSGVRMGKLIYRSLKVRETAHRAIACVTDNASANAVMNTTLANRIREREDAHVHGKGMSFTCVNHAFHLVCTDILSHLGVIEPGDHYTDVKGDDPNSENDLEDDADLMDSDLDAGSDSDLDDDLLAELGLDLDIDEGATGSVGKSTGATNRGRGRSHKSKVLNAAEKVHEIMVYVTASPKRRKEMRQIIAQTCPNDKKHLFVKKSMRIRWGSVRAEVKRAIELRSAIAHFVATLDSSKPRGKLRDRARKLQERWSFKSEEWDLLAMLIEILDPFHTATEAMSRSDVPTLAEVIPTFALLERKLLDNMAKLRGSGHGDASSRALLSGLEAGLAKLQKYRALAHQSELCLIATVLNPRLRLKYLERWPEAHSRAGTIFAYIFENYRVQFASETDPPVGLTPPSDPPFKSTNHWANEIYSDVPSFVEQFDRELQEYLNGSYPCPPGMDTLGWWKVHNHHFSAIARMARDFLCIPAASVSVERLFSQCKLTMTDIQSSMSFETARRRICCQHWLKAGVDVDMVREALGID